MAGIQTSPDIAEGVSPVENLPVETPMQLVIQPNAEPDITTIQSAPEAIEDPIFPSPLQAVVPQLEQAIPPAEALLTPEENSKQFIPGLTHVKFEAIEWTGEHLEKPKEQEKPEEKEDLPTEMGQIPTRFAQPQQVFPEEGIYVASSVHFEQVPSPLIEEPQTGPHEAADVLVPESTEDKEREEGFLHRKESQHQYQSLPATEDDPRRASVITENEAGEFLVASSEHNEQEAAECVFTPIIGACVEGGVAVISGMSGQPKPYHQEKRAEDPGDVPFVRVSSKPLFEAEAWSGDHHEHELPHESLEAGGLQLGIVGVQESAVSDSEQENQLVENQSEVSERLVASSTLESEQTKQEEANAEEPVKIQSTELPTELAFSAEETGEVSHPPFIAPESELKQFELLPPHPTDSSGEVDAEINLDLSQPTSLTENIQVESTGTPPTMFQGIGVTQALGEVTQKIVTQSHQSSQIQSSQIQSSHSETTHSSSIAANKSAAHHASIVVQGIQEGQPIVGSIVQEVVSSQSADPKIKATGISQALGEVNQQVISQSHQSSQHTQSQATEKTQPPAVADPVSEPGNLATMVKGIDHPIVGSNAQQVMGTPPADPNIKVSEVTHAMGALSQELSSQSYQSSHKSQKIYSETTHSNAVAEPQSLADNAATVVQGIQQGQPIVGGVFKGFMGPQPVDPNVKASYSHVSSHQEVSQRSGQLHPDVKTLAEGYLPVIFGIYKGEYVNSGIVPVAAVSGAPSAFKPANESLVASDPLTKLHDQLKQLGMTSGAPGSGLQDLTQEALGKCGPGAQVQVQMSSQRHKQTRTMHYETSHTSHSQEQQLDRQGAMELQASLLQQLKEAGAGFGVGDAYQRLTAAMPGFSPKKDEEGVRTPPSTPKQQEEPVTTDQQKESMEEGFIDEHGNVVVSKKVTRVVTTTRTVVEGDDEVPISETVQSVHTVASSGDVEASPDGQIPSPD